MPPMHFNPVLNKVNTHNTLLHWVLRTEITKKLRKKPLYDKFQNSISSWNG